MDYYYLYIIFVLLYCIYRYVIDDEYISLIGIKFFVKWVFFEVLSYIRFSSKSDVWVYGRKVFNVVSICICGFF